MEVMRMSEKIDDQGRLQLNIPTNLPKGRVDLVLIINMDKQDLQDKSFFFKQNFSCPSCLSMVIQIRRETKLKLPDAIILAAAIQTNSKLVTADRRLIERKEIEVIDYSR